MRKYLYMKSVHHTHTHTERTDAMGHLLRGRRIGELLHEARHSLVTSLLARSAAQAADTLRNRLQRLPGNRRVARVHDAHQLVKQRAEGASLLVGCC